MADLDQLSVHGNNHAFQLYTVHIKRERALILKAGVQDDSQGLAPAVKSFRPFLSQSVFPKDNPRLLTEDVWIVKRKLQGKILQ